MGIGHMNIRIIYVLKGSNLNYDSYMVPTSELKLGQSRLLEVDNAVSVTGKNTYTRYCYSYRRFA